MATLENLLDRQKEVSDKLSNQVRTLAVAYLVGTWGMLSATSALPLEIAQKFSPLLIAVAFFSAAALVSDFLHYLCGYIVVREAIQHLRANDLSDGSYDEKTLFYRGQFVFFFGKQVAILLATVMAAITFLFEMSDRLFA